MSDAGVASVRMWHYPGCDTCRKARRWLSDHGVEHDLVHIVDEPPDRETLRDLWRRSGLPLPKLFNTSGQSYREGGFKDRVKSMTEDESLAALAADGKLIKRPLVSHPGGALVGFKADTWSEVFSD